MEIAALNVKVMFQKGTPVSDEIGNRANIWEDCFSCYATVSGEGGTENAVAGLTVENADCAFTVRWCKALDTVCSTGYRIAFAGEIYNILSIDHLNYKKKALKFKCRKARR